MSAVGTILPPSGKSRIPKPLFSITITLFRSEQDLPHLIESLCVFADEHRASFDLECVFVSDGCPEKCVDYLRRRLSTVGNFSSQLHVLSRNFGATFAQRHALRSAKGDYFAPIPPDMQEPLSLARRAFEELASGACDVCFGVRTRRADPLLSRLLSSLHWGIQRRLISREIPIGGVDFFACNRKVRDGILQYGEKNSFLVGLVFSLGFRRRFINYERGARRLGKSSWTMKKKISYFLDSVFNFSAKPITLLYAIAFFGLTSASVLGGSLLASKLLGTPSLPPYTLMLALICFFGGLNGLGLAVLGEYVWRIAENVARRPLSLLENSFTFPPPEGQG